MMKFIDKYEKYVYPLMSALSLIAAGLAFMSGNDWTWQIVTFSWVVIAWNNFSKLQK